ncbi:hypothetical protein F4861DRAFT_536435 [Xylaria intraflava]|nr:hypothetical protein F4861DRAFT_536435 [Xylaria intraflava]
MPRKDDLTDSIRRHEASWDFIDVLIPVNKHVTDLRGGKCAWNMDKATVNTDKVVCGYDISNPHINIRICTWSILKILQYLVAENINPDNTDLVLGKKATWEAMLKAAKFFNAVVYEARRIIDPEKRRFNNMIADEVVSQLHWAQKNPAQSPLLSQRATGYWEWDPAARDIDYLFHVAVTSKFIPLRDISQMSDQQQGRKERPIPSFQESGHSTTTYKSCSRPGSEKVCQLAEDPIDRMTSTLHRAAIMARVGSRQKNGDVGEFGECLAEVEQHRPAIRGAIWSWTSP